MNYLFISLLSPSSSSIINNNKQLQKLLNVHAHRLKYSKHRWTFLAYHRNTSGCPICRNISLYIHNTPATRCTPSYTKVIRLFVEETRTQKKHRWRHITEIHAVHCMQMLSDVWRSNTRNNFLWKQSVMGLTAYSRQNVTEFGRITTPTRCD